MQKFTYTRTITFCTPNGERPDFVLHSTLTFETSAGNQPQYDDQAKDSSSNHQFHLETLQPHLTSQLPSLPLEAVSLYSIRIPPEAHQLQTPYKFKISFKLYNQISDGMYLELQVFCFVHQKFNFLPTIQNLPSKKRWGLLHPFPMNLLMHQMLYNRETQMVKTHQLIFFR